MLSLPLYRESQPVVSVDSTIYGTSSMFKKKKKRARARINDLNGRNSTPPILSPPLTYRRNQLTEVREIVCSILLITAVILSAFISGDISVFASSRFRNSEKSKQAAAKGGWLAHHPWYKNRETSAQERTRLGLPVDVQCILSLRTYF